MPKEEIADVVRLLEAQNEVLGIVLERLIHIESRVQAVALGQLYSFQLGGAALSGKQTRAVARAMKKHYEAAAARNAKKVNQRVKARTGYPGFPPASGLN